MAEEKEGQDMTLLDKLCAFEWWVRQDVRAKADEEREAREYSCENGVMETWRQECHDGLRRHIREELLKSRQRILDGEDDHART